MPDGVGTKAKIVKGLLVAIAIVIVVCLRKRDRPRWFTCVRERQEIKV